VHSTVDAHLAKQENWPPVTDYDRLRVAFERLESAGIVTRQDFTCCGTCGAGAIVGEIEIARAGGRAIRGYTFFHMQDTEAAVEGHGLCLAYGATEEGEVPALAVAREVIETLKAEGLKTQWDGTWHQRISVALDWKRRR
jgi:hypothetical protein